MNTYKNAGMVLGFALIVFGFTSIILQMVVIHWAFLGFLEWGGRLFAFLSKILMIFGGATLFMLVRTDWDRERRESE